MPQLLRVASKSEIPSNTGKCVEINGREIALYMIDGKVHAMNQICPHQGGPLAEGGLDGTIVTCRGLDCQPAAS